MIRTKQEGLTRVEPYEAGYYDSFHHPEQLHRITAGKTVDGDRDYQRGWADGLGDQEILDRETVVWTDFVVREVYE